MYWINRFARPYPEPRLEAAGRGQAQKQGGNTGVGCAVAVHKREGADMAIVYLEEDDDAADENRDAALTISEEWAD